MTTTRYSIKDLENFTGIKAHTIRIWEQRYGLLSPKRTETNIRYYSEDDLKKILNINLLYTNGLKISKIAALVPAEIQQRAKEIILNSQDDHQSTIDKLIISILAFDGSKIQELLESELQNHDIVWLYEEIILPLLEKVGELWQVNSILVTHEHFFSQIFREFLLAKIHLLKNTNTAQKALLFLHDHEEHEFALLISYYQLKQAGIQCFYLGQKTPIDEILKTQQSINAQLIISSFIAKISEKEFAKIMEKLNELQKSSTVIINGQQAERFINNIPQGIHYIKTPHDLDSFIHPSSKKGHNS